ncbi:hypothetical protein [Cellulosimicrobium sp. Marseille-Q4280]|uniref:hypothetical protein n=1 Tax=Cellulosimicrobium sp. Marseille-Q4280 TaxID=2937992 RepID=UPI00203D993B|nr:hypothetical protein [Cellulosimicrobium sp. Marseille-Q4280]
MSGADELAPGPGALDMLLAGPWAAAAAVALAVALIVTGMTLRRVVAKARAARSTLNPPSEARL